MSDKKKSIIAIISVFIMAIGVILALTGAEVIKWIPFVIISMILAKIGLLKK